MPYVCNPKLVRAFVSNELKRAHVVKLVDTSDLGSDAARYGGSSPSMRTTRKVGHL
jgi:hypothetical protein